MRIDSCGIPRTLGTRVTRTDRRLGALLHGWTRAISGHGAAHYAFDCARQLCHRRRACHRPQRSLGSSDIQEVQGPQGNDACDGFILGTVGRSTSCQRARQVNGDQDTLEMATRVALVRVLSGLCWCRWRRYCSARRGM